MYHFLVFIWLCVRFETVSPGRSDCYIFFPRQKIGTGGQSITTVTTIGGCMKQSFVDESRHIIDYNAKNRSCNRSTDSHATLVPNTNFVAVEFFGNCDNLPTTELCVPPGPIILEHMLFDTSESCFEACRANASCMGSIFIGSCERLISIQPEQLANSGKLDDGKVFMKTEPCNETGSIPKEETIKTTSEINTTPFLLSDAPVNVSTNEKSTTVTVQLSPGITEAGSHSNESNGTSWSTMGFNTTVTSPLTLTVLSNLLAETTTQTAVHSSGSTGHLLSSETHGHPSPTYPITLQYSPSSRTLKRTKIPANIATESGSSEEPDNASDTHKPISVLYRNMTTKTVGLNGRSTTSVSDGIYPGSTETRKQSLLSTVLRITWYTDSDSSEQFGTGTTLTSLDRSTPRRTFGIAESMITVTAAPLRTVYDDRPSAVVLGSFGLVFLCVLGVLIILSDIRKLKRDIFNFAQS